MSQLPPPPPGQPYQPYQPYQEPPKNSSKALWIILGVAAGVIILCGGFGGIIVALSDDSSDSDGKGKDLDTQEPQFGSSSSPSEEDSENLGEILESGFGQDGQYAWVTAIVHNLADHGGQTVTVSFNVLDKNGELLGSESQVESFNVADQTLAVGTQVDLGSAHARAASVEPTLLVEDEGTFEDTGIDLGVYEADSIKVDQYSKTTWHAKFTIPNNTDEALQSPRIGIACWDEDGHINGGGVDFPDLIAPGSKVLIDPFLITSGEPATCKAYVGAPAF